MLRPAIITHKSKSRDGAVPAFANSTAQECQTKTQVLPILCSPILSVDCLTCTATILHIMCSQNVLQKKRMFFLLCIFKKICKEPFPQGSRGLYFDCRLMPKIIFIPGNGAQQGWLSNSDSFAGNGQDQASLNTWQLADPNWVSGRKG